MPVRLDVRVSGLPALERKLDTSRLAGAAARSWLAKSARLIAEDARRRAPRDTGRLAGSIQPRQTETTWPYAFAVVAGARYARFVHGGMRGPVTGLRTRPHWPPVAALRAWAARHGISPYLVAHAISERGTPIVKFLTAAIESNAGRVEQFTTEAARDVEREWGR